MQDLITFTGPDGRPTQLFNGVTYKLYTADLRYFKSTKRRGTRLHVDVWSFYNGTRPPKGYHVHHIDENKHNNLPDNLELIKAGRHMKEHVRKRLKEDPQYFQELGKVGRKAVLEWNKTPEGKSKRRQHGLTVLATASKRLIEGTTIKKCQNCGNEYSIHLLNAITSRFCSNKCKTADRNRSGVDDIVRECAVCSKSFIINKYTKTKTCSRSCSAILQWRTRK